jgi:hypothetical protein
VRTTTCTGTWTLPGGRPGSGPIRGADRTDEGWDIPVRALAHEASVDKVTALLPLGLFVVFLGFSAYMVVCVRRFTRRRPAARSTADAPPRDQ